MRWSLVVTQKNKINKMCENNGKTLILTLNLILPLLPNSYYWVIWPTAETPTLLFGLYMFLKSNNLIFWTICIFEFLESVHYMGSNYSV